MALRAHVAHGRIILDEPTDLPEGTVLDLVADDEGDDLDEEERQKLEAALAESDAQFARGEFVTWEEVAASLRPKR